MTIVLPIPSQALSPNGRCHWRKKARIVKAHRGRAAIATKLALDGQPGPPALAYSYTYYWSRNRRDDDNAIASAKAYLDGICQALGIDDRTLRFRELVHHNDRTDPRLEITLHLS